MIFQRTIDLLPGSYILLGCGVLVLYLLVQYILDPLRDIPGPFLARFTRFWYFLEIYKGKFEHSDMDLHKRYGPIVRIAPREYSIDDVEAAKTIYGHGGAFPKVDMSTPVQHSCRIAHYWRRLGIGLGCHRMRQRPRSSRTSIHIDMVCSAASFPRSIP